MYTSSTRKMLQDEGSRTSGASDYGNYGGSSSARASSASYSSSTSSNPQHIRSVNNVNSTRALTVYDGKEPANDAYSINALGSDLNEAHNRVAEAEHRCIEALKRTEIQLTEQVRAANHALQQMISAKDTQLDTAVGIKDAEIAELKRKLFNETTQDDVRAQALSAKRSTIQQLLAQLESERLLRQKVEDERSAVDARAEELRVSLQKNEQLSLRQRNALNIFREAHNNLESRVQVIKTKSY